MKFLVIDDNATSRLLLRKILLQLFEECEVIEAATAWAGLYHIEIDEPRVVFVDVFMPEFNGIKLLQTIRQHDRFRHTPVIVVTSSTEPRHVMAMMALTVAGYVLKPIRPEVIEEQVRRVVGIPAGPSDQPPAEDAGGEEAAEVSAMDLPLPEDSDRPYGVW